MARILVVEDNAANMKLAAFLLQSAGHAVLCAVDAETGLTLARTDQPDLILMDIQLPGMDGLAATALLKEDQSTAAIPVIALTAMAMKGPGKEPSGRLRRVHRQTAALPGTLCRHRSPAGPSKSRGQPARENRSARPHHERSCRDHPHRRRRDPEPQAARSAAAAGGLSHGVRRQRRGGAGLGCAAGARPDLARRHDAGYGRIRRRHRAQSQSRQLEYSHHHGDGAGRPRSPPGGSQCRGGRVFDEAGRPGRIVAAGAQPAALESIRGFSAEPQPDPGPAGAGAHRPNCSASGPRWTRPRTPLRWSTAAPCDLSKPMRPPAGCTAIRARKCFRRIRRGSRRLPPNNSKVSTMP